MSFSTSVRRAGKVLLWAILAALVLVAAWIAGVILLPRPAVGIMHIDMEIWSESASLFKAQIEEAREDSRIKAVVVCIDSPGGEVIATEDVFLELQRLREEMPVVGSIDNMAASGGYYLAVATDPIYAKPSSDVGNVGVWAIVPPELTVDDVILASGPFKLTGSNRDEFTQQLEGIRQEFVEAVFSQRGERMQLSRAELSQGLLYAGRSAKNLGLIDHIGTQTDAVQAAAEAAGIASYKEVDLRDRVWEDWLNQWLIKGAEEPEPWIGAADPLTGERTLPYGIYLLYDARLRGVP